MPMCGSMVIGTWASSVGRMLLRGIAGGVVMWQKAYHLLLLSLCVVYKEIVLWLEY